MWIIYVRDIPSTMFSHLTNNYHFDLVEQRECIIYLVTKCQTSGPDLQEIITTTQDPQNHFVSLILMMGKWCELN